jgi:hypothetical protein
MNHQEKVIEIFQELVGEKASRLDGNVYLKDVTQRIAQSLLNDQEKTIDPEMAKDIGFHMIDWQSNAAFIVALSLFPEKFTDEEIRQGIEGLMIHAPAHILEACRLSGIDAENIFIEEEQK